MPRRLTALVPTLIVTALLASACSSDEGRTTGVGAAAAGGSTVGAPRPAPADAALDVVAAFYPLQFVAERVGGDRVAVRTLTPPGGEPHDLELTPRDLQTVGKADVVLYLGGFQPAVDDAVAQEAEDAAVDVAPLAPSDLHADERDEHAGEHAEDDHGDEADGTTDPHFWLDPTRLRNVATAVADRFAAADADGAQGYRDRAAALRKELETLDGEARTALATCQKREFVTSHTAFGYLAHRYELQQVGIAGLSPDTEPSPRALAKAAAFVREHDVSTVFYETLVSPDVSRTVAEETGADTAVLDPIEGLTGESAGADYLAVMRANVDALAKALECD